MSKSAIFFVLIYTGGIILAFVKDPFYGLATYLFEYYNHPPYNWWGRDLPRLRWSLVIAVITLVAYMVKKGNFSESNSLKVPQTKWLLLFVATALVVTPFAVSVDESWGYSVQLLKLVVLYFLTIKLVRTKKQYQILIWIHLICAWYWGFQAYQAPEMNAGRLYGIGGAGAYGENAMAAHMMTVLPFLGYYFVEGGKWKRILTILIAPFVLNLVILASSRGTTVAMLVAFPAFIFLSRGNIKLKKMIFAIVLIGILFVRLADDRFMERQKTISTYQEDGSAMGRLVSWKGALQLMKEHPFGAGGGGFNQLSPIYIPTVVEAHGGQLRSVHNTFLLAGSEWGILGLFFFCMFSGSTIIGLHRIRTKSPKDENESRLNVESLAIEVSLIGYLVASVFVNMLYLETLYWLCGAAAALQNGAFSRESSSSVSRTELAKREFIRPKPVLARNAYLIIFSILASGVGGCILTFGWSQILMIIIGSLVLVALLTMLLIGILRARKEKIDSQRLVHISHE